VRRTSSTSPRNPSTALILRKIAFPWSFWHGGLIMAKEIIATDRAPKAIGPYSQGVKAGNLIFFSGQIPLDPETGEMVGKGIAEQTERVMENIAALLEAAGLGFADVVKSTIYLTDLANFAVVNDVYGRRFQADPPARSTVEVKGLPRGAGVEIEIIALCKG
jgi:2-iminobutanoate/2-iminopropanoate deaminase